MMMMMMMNVAIIQTQSKWKSFMDTHVCIFTMNQRIILSN